VKKRKGITNKGLPTTSVGKQKMRDRRGIGGWWPEERERPGL